MRAAAAVRTSKENKKKRMGNISKDD